LGFLHRQEGTWLHSPIQKKHASKIWWLSGWIWLFCTLRIFAGFRALRGTLYIPYASRIELSPTKESDGLACFETRCNYLVSSARMDAQVWKTRSPLFTTWAPRLGDHNSLQETKRPWQLLSSSHNASHI
jgi:hypothetical protein